MIAMNTMLIWISKENINFPRRIQKFSLNLKVVALSLNIDIANFSAFTAFFYAAYIRIFKNMNTKQLSNTQHHKKYALKKAHMIG